MGGAIMTQLPVIIFAFRCQQNVPIFYAELRRQKRCEIDSRFAIKRTKMMLASNIGTFLAGALYAIAAVCGYIAFREDTKSDVLQNFGSFFRPAYFVRVCYVMIIVCSYPVMTFSAVVSFHRLVWSVANLRSSNKGIDTENMSKQAAASPSAVDPFVED